jgi:hypothetical protein
MGMKHKKKFVLQSHKSKTLKNGKGCFTLASYGKYFFNSFKDKLRIK